MKNKTYFISGYHLLAFVHNETKNDIILGGLCEFYNDAKNNILRQKISKAEFSKMTTILLDEKKLSSYTFLETSPMLHVWKVTDSVQHKKMIFYLKNAIELENQKFTCQL